MRMRRATPVKQSSSRAQVAFGRAAIGAMGLGALAVGPRLWARWQSAPWRSGRSP